MSDDLYNKRIWELDFLRGIAVLSMIYFHLIYDLSEIAGLEVSYQTGLNHFSGRLAGWLFIIISGISCSFSRNNIRRGIRIIVYALLISIVTLIYDPDSVIIFGILHFLGASILLYSLFKNLPKYLLLFFSIVIFTAQYLVACIEPENNILAPLGVHNSSFSSGDYYPLIPYLAMFLIGIFLGKLLYKHKRSFFPSIKKDNFINYTGRHSLIIYMIHQPVLIMIITLIKYL